MSEARPTSELLLTPNAQDAGERLDRFVAARCEQLSRARVQELIDAGLVKVDGQEAKASYRLRGSEIVSVHAEPRAALRAEPEAIPLDVLYEDEDLVVVNKPASMTVHAGAGKSRGTLVNALLGRGHALSAGGDVLRPGIVHRLDKDTSGAILIAKNDVAHARLADAFRDREVKKTYLALVQGRLEAASGRIELAIGRDPKTRVRMTARKSDVGGKLRAARTDWRTLATIDGCTLVQIQLHTGRTHQIRVHFSAIRHPVVGDTLYGAAERIHAGKTTLPALGRQFLHAATLVFTQPRTGETVEVRAPLAAELQEFLKRLMEASRDGAEAAKIDAALRPFL